jgi:hypothetical protein
MRPERAIYNTKLDIGQLAVNKKTVDNEICNPISGPDIISFTIYSLTIYYCREIADFTLKLSN